MGTMRWLGKLVAGLLAGVITGHPPRGLIAPHKKDAHHAQASEPDHIHPELFQPGYLSTSAAAIVGTGPGPAAVPFVDSNDWEQAAYAAVRAHHNQLQRRAYLIQSSFASHLE